jgi:hypothetical protein
MIASYFFAPSRLCVRFLFYFILRVLRVSVVILFLFF